MAHALLITTPDEALRLLSDWFDRRSELVCKCDAAGFSLGFIGAIDHLDREGQSFTLFNKGVRRAVMSVTFTHAYIYFTDPRIGKTEEDRDLFDHTFRHALVFALPSGLDVFLSEPTEDAPPLFAV